MKEGYLIDYISGIEVPDGPEEREATQVFSKILVEDYNYPITTEVLTQGIYGAFGKVSSVVYKG